MLEDKDRKRLAGDLHNILSDTPGLTKVGLLDSLDKRHWPQITTSNINSVLYEAGAPFRRSDDTLPRWYAIGSISISPVLPPPLPSFYEGPEPRVWQKEAFDAWHLAGRRGIVEAVTGTGKTTVGILAADAVVRGLRVLIIVPGLDLLDQWYEKLCQDLPDLAIGRFGDTWKDTLYDYDIVVSTVQSAYKNIILPEHNSGLLIADEVHRYGAEKFAAALEKRYDERLGLTATYERDDDGIANFLTPYFKPRGRTGNEIVAGCSYARGLEDGILAPFKVALVGVDLTDSEREKYDQFSGQISKHWNQLVHDFGCPAEPFGEFIRAVSRLSEGGYHPDMTRSAIIFLNAFTKRRALLAETTAKIEALNLLSPALRRSECALVFTETIDGANLASARLVEHGVDAHPYTSEMNRDTRKAVLADFRSGSIRVLTAPRVLDEGIDLPKADVGVIIAASRSRRQMVQRMGRIIRPKQDKRPAVFVILYVRNTSEDPELGAHETFLNEMQDNALDCRYIDIYRNPKALNAFITR